MGANDKNKKNKKKSKKKEKIENEEEINESSQPYIFIESKQPFNDNEQDEESVNRFKYQKVVSCSNSFVVLDADANLHSFGNNEFGALGLGKDISESLKPQMISSGNESKTKIRSISSYVNGCLAMDSESNIWFWGKQFNQRDDEIHFDAIYEPTNITMKSKENSITKVVVTSVGGFLWTK